MLRLRGASDGAFGAFVPGAWGHRLVDPLKSADVTVEKIDDSESYMTRLEWVLRKAGIGTLLVCGVVTNTGVASTYPWRKSAPA